MSSASSSSNPPNPNDNNNNANSNDDQLFDAAFREVDALCCPITCDLFVDPVLLESGHTFERDAITRHLATYGKNPLTNEPASVDELRPNRAIRDVVSEFRERQPQWHELVERLRRHKQQQQEQAAEAGSLSSKKMHQMQYQNEYLRSRQLYAQRGQLSAAQNDERVRVLLWDVAGLERGALFTHCRRHMINVWMASLRDDWKTMCTHVDEIFAYACEQRLELTATEHAVLWVQRGSTDQKRAKLAKRVDDIKSSLGRAIQSFEAAIDLDNRFVPALLGMAWAHDRLSQLVDLKNDAGAIDKKRQYNRKALHFCNLAIHVDPDRASSFEVKGRVARTLAMIDEDDDQLHNQYKIMSMDALRECVRLNPHSAKAWCIIGELLKEENQFGDATDAFQRAVDAQPHDSISIQKLGKCFQDQAKYASAQRRQQLLKQAIEQYERALVLDIDMKKAKSGLKQCRSLLKGNNDNNNHNKNNNNKSNNNKSKNNDNNNNSYSNNNNTDEKYAHLLEQIEINYAMLTNPRALQEDKEEALRVLDELEADRDQFHIGLRVPSKNRNNNSNHNNDHNDSEGARMWRERGGGRGGRDGRGGRHRGRGRGFGRGGGRRGGNREHH